MQYTLITLDDRALAEEVKQIATEVSNEPDDVKSYIAESFEEAKQHLEDLPIDLLITGLHVRSNFKEPLKESEEKGLALLAWAAKRYPNIPSILVTPNLGEAHMQRISNVISEFYRSSFVFEGSEFIRNLRGCMGDKLGSRAHRQQSQDTVRQLTVEISVGSHTEGQYHIFGCGFDAKGRFPLNHEGLQNLKKTSSLIGRARSDEWEDDLTDVGERLLDVIQRGSNSSFQWDLATGLERADGDIERTKVCFIVHRDYYPLLFEALSFPRHPEHWMLKAPIYRRLSNDGTFEQPAPFNGDGYGFRPVNCLIINANIHDAEVSGVETVSGRPLFLESLTKVDDECIELEIQLNQSKRDGANIGDIAVVPTNGSKATSTEVKRILENKTWDLVHFAGHSYYNERDDRGYVFFQDEFVKPVEIAEFSQWLRKTKFVFLSSCRSSERRFVYELADYQVPAICGFRWKIDDEMAYKLALTFYKHLFIEPSIELAFLRTRQDIHELNSNDRTWAAPMLIQQT